MCQKQEGTAGCSFHLILTPARPHSVLTDQSRRFSRSKGTKKSLQRKKSDECILVIQCVSSISWTMNHASSVDFSGKPDSEWGNTSQPFRQQSLKLQRNGLHHLSFYDFFVDVMLHSTLPREGNVFFFVKD